MSTREPMWYCHECNAEMRPLMMPDPHCASCSGTFVEKMENPEDDPREFHNAGMRLGEGLGAINFLANLSEILRESSPTSSTGRSDQSSPGSSPLRNGSTSPTTSSMGMRFEFGGPGGARRTFVVGGPNILNRRESETSANGSANIPGTPPRLSEFLRANNRSDGSESTRDTNIPGNLMAQYMMALLGGGVIGGRGMSPFFGPMGLNEDGPPGEGRWGDYVFTQDALDQIITQLMEGANATRPVPASEDVVDKLPREVLEEGSPLLEKDCAICKEQFSAHAEEPDEQVVVNLPCKHTFHEGCILPWLKSSGTCPVCRFALVPQPNADGHGPPGPSSDASGSSSSRSPPRTSDPPRSGGNERSPGSDTGSGPGSGSGTGRGSSGNNGHGLFSTIFGHRVHPGSSPPSESNVHSGHRFRDAINSINPRERRTRQNTRDSEGECESRRIPGSWSDLD